MFIILHTVIHLVVLCYSTWGGKKIPFYVGYADTQNMNISFCKRTQHCSFLPGFASMTMLQLPNWQVGVVAKPLSCGAVRPKAKALPPCSDVLHSKTGFAVSMTNRSVCDKLFRRAVVGGNLSAKKKRLKNIRLLDGAYFFYKLLRQQKDTP